MSLPHFLSLVSQSQAKFSIEMAQQALSWIEAVLGKQLDLPDGVDGLKDQADFGAALRDGSVLCELINSLRPGSVKKINTMKAPFKQVQTRKRTRPPTVVCKMEAQLEYIPYIYLHTYTYIAYIFLHVWRQYVCSVRAYYQNFCVRPQSEVF